MSCRRGSSQSGILRDIGCRSGEYIRRKSVLNFCFVFNALRTKRPGPASETEWRDRRICWTHPYHSPCTSPHPPGFARAKPGLNQAGEILPRPFGRSFIPCADGALPQRGTLSATSQENVPFQFSCACVRAHLDPARSTASAARCRWKPRFDSEAVNKPCPSDAASLVGVCCVVLHSR